MYTNWKAQRNAILTVPATISLAKDFDINFNQSPISVSFRGGIKCLPDWVESMYTQSMHKGRSIDYRISWFNFEITVTYLICIPPWHGHDSLWRRKNDGRITGWTLQTWRKVRSSCHWPWRKPRRIWLRGRRGGCSRGSKRRHWY